MCADFAYMLVLADPVRNDSPERPERTELVRRGSQEGEAEDEGQSDHGMDDWQVLRRHVGHAAGSGASRASSMRCGTGRLQVHVHCSRVLSWRRAATEPVDINQQLT